MGKRASTELLESCRLNLSNLSGLFVLIVCLFQVYIKTKYRLPIGEDVGSVPFPEYEVRKGANKIQKF